MGRTRVPPWGWIGIAVLLVGTHAGVGRAQPQPLAQPVASPVSAPPQEAQVREHLAQERAGLALLRSQKVGVLDVLEVLEALSRSGQARLSVLEHELSLLRARIQVATRQETIAMEAKRRLGERLSPRLWALYRVGRHQALGALLTSDDLASLIWRSKALAKVLERDLGLLRELRDVSRFQQRSARMLALLREGLADRMTQIREEQTRARARSEELGAVLGAIREEAKHSTRLVRELEAAQANLVKLMDETGQSASPMGFAALKGKLPYPAAGVVEVGYGHVINPKFNTVTVQKGVDLRAAWGTPVRAVAPGRVAYGGWLRGYGNVLLIDHGDGFHTLMAHLADLTVAVGAEVDRGTEVGAVGDTGSLKGAYLYFEIRHHGQAMDPGPWLSERARFR